MRERELASWPTASRQQAAQHSPRPQVTQHEGHAQHTPSRWSKQQNAAEECHIVLLILFSIEEGISLQQEESLLCLVMCVDQCPMLQHPKSIRGAINAPTPKNAMLIPTKSSFLSRDGCPKSNGIGIDFVQAINSEACRLGQKYMQRRVPVEMLVYVLLA